MKKHFLKKAFVVAAMAFSLTLLGAIPSFASCPHCQGAAVEIDEEPNAGQKCALEVFPQQDQRYGLKAFLEKFKPVVAPVLWDDFNMAWRFIMEAGEDVPHLSVKAEIGHIQCLYGKLWNAHDDKTEGWVVTQQGDIYAALNHPTHMKLITVGKEALAARMSLYSKFLEDARGALNRPELLEMFQTGFHSIFTYKTPSVSIESERGMLEAFIRRLFAADLESDRVSMLLGSFKAPTNRAILVEHNSGFLKEVKAYQTSVLAAEAKAKAKAAAAAEAAAVVGDDGENKQ